MCSMLRCIVSSWCSYRCVSIITSTVLSANECLTIKICRYIKHFILLVFYFLTSIVLLFSIFVSLNSWVFLMLYRLFSPLLQTSLRLMHMEVVRNK